jgi:HK97 family phage prohead protease
MRQPDVSRVWSQLRIKSLNDGERTIEGVASTPETDRVGDVVEPAGAKYKLPLPFLWQHDSEQPIGHVVRATPNATGIPVTIQLARADEPGTLKDRLDEAWQSIKLGLVKGLSIGFRPIEYSYIEATGGYRFSVWDWLELSAVTVAANQDASISTIKRCDLGLTPRSHEGVPLSFLKSENQSVQLPFLRPENRKGNAHPWPFKKSMTWEKTNPSQFASQLGKHLLESIGGIMVDALTVRDAKIKSLEAELAARTYKEVWDPAVKYSKHNMCTRHGSLWIALEDNPGEPGRSPGWKMAVKKGRDAQRR